jgi:hypothetical protein
MIDMAQSPNQSNPINLSDPHVEHGIVVKAALDIIYDRELDTSNIDKLRKVYIHVIEFARKWDIPSILRTIKTAIRASSHPKDSHSFSLFTLAVELGDHDLISITTNLLINRSWSSKDSSDPTSAEIKALPVKELTFKDPTCAGSFDSPLAYIKGAQSGDIGGWAYRVFEIMPKPVIWAMSRARRNTQGVSTTEGWSRVPSELKKLLDSMCEFSSIQSCRVRILTGPVDPEEIPNGSD